MAKRPPFRAKSRPTSKNFRLRRTQRLLEKDIRNWVAGWNENPKPFIWTKTAEQILESLSRLLQRINGAKH
jgi:hypothetical protein